MAAVSQARMNICGSHAGVSIGEDGPSQMGLEDLAAFRAVHNSTVLYPSDAVQTAQLVALMADLDKGIAYLRTTRGNTEVIYGPDETFEIGGSKVLRSSDDDKVTIVAAGITLHESLKAADALASEGINARVIDLYSVKPIDSATLAEAARATDGRVLTVEDHWAEGGIGDAVAAALGEAQLDTPLRLVKIAVTSMPGSAKPDECIAAAGLDAESIAGAARKLAG
jgi:transketolase